MQLNKRWIINSYKELGHIGIIHLPVTKMVCISNCMSHPKNWQAYNQRGVYGKLTSKLFTSLTYGELLSFLRGEPRVSSWVNNEVFLLATMNYLFSQRHVCWLCWRHSSTGVWWQVFITEIAIHGQLHAIVNFIMHNLLRGVQTHESCV